MLTLKKYQADALDVLRKFLSSCRSKPVDAAFAEALADQERDEPYHDVFGAAPSVCLRIPTGGGKTLLATHAIAAVGSTWQDTDSPVVLWLTPSDAIRAQTLVGLSDARHPYRQALAEHFGDRVVVCELESLQTIGVQDVGRACIVVIATIQAFNVTDTAKRNVYSFFEELAPHFDSLSPAAAEGLERVTPEDVAAQSFLSAADIGRVKYSVANWLHRQRPLVIVDEAHNNRTDRFFRSLGRLNPSCVVELTATPVPGNNVLYRVSAAELKAEDMIKLPIVLAEHPEGWQACLRDALLTRSHLETVAQKERSYLRPIALIQAAPKGGDATVEVVRQFLVDELKVPEAHIAVATGSQKELDGIDLLDHACQIRCVVTVEALKEGWDCPFAYVLASLQSVRSAKDVEQLLGRVLRMPYAKSQQQDALNRAYAHIVATSFAEAAANLRDRMVQNMGFERLEASSLLLPPQHKLPLAGGTGDKPVPDCHIQLDHVPDVAHWTDEVRQVARVLPTSTGATVLVAGDADPATLAQVEAFVTQSAPATARADVAQQFQAHRDMRRAMRAPAQLGDRFAAIPQLCLDLDGRLEVVERETLAGFGEWNLLDQPIRLPSFAIHETINSFEIDVDGERVKYRHVDAQQLDLNAIASDVTEQDLVRWLDAQTRRPTINQAELQAWLVKLVSHLIRERGFTLTALVRARHLLARAIDSEIDRQRAAATERGFQRQLIAMTVAPTALDPLLSFRFEPGRYPARNIYQGSYEFQKHFYPVIHQLREFTAGKRRTEEFQCARALDSHPKVKHWVRNIERQERTSFWFPTATDYFYPDFVAELVDGRVLVVEYKGEAYATNDDSREKRQVGEQWERTSDGRCLFLFALAEDDVGRSVEKQIADKIG